MKTISILNVPIHEATYAGVLEAMNEWCAATPRTPHAVVVANVHVVTEAALQPAYHAAVTEAALVVPDGTPLMWSMRWLGSPIRERCYGPTLMQLALMSFRTQQRTHFFYGSTDETLAKLKRQVVRRWPGVRIVGMHSPPFGPFDDEAEICNILEINRAAPDILWVAMGCPKQELWMHRYRHVLKVPVVIGVGAAFDFIAGTVRQAPPLLQRVGLEWFFRLCIEPRRLWRRYVFRNPYFVAQLFLQLTGLRWYQKPPAAEPAP